MPVANDAPRHNGRVAQRVGSRPWGAVSYTLLSMGLGEIMPVANDAPRHNTRNRGGRVAQRVGSRPWGAVS